MGLLKGIRGIWNPKARAESTVEAQIDCFTKNMRNLPERDPNAWLALTLQARSLGGWRDLPPLQYFSDTALYSLAPGTHAPFALGLFILYKEEPTLAVAYEADFERVMSPIFALAESGELESRWRTTNPWTAQRHPEVGSALSQQIRTYADN
jgi:hypothetical protein